VSKQLTEITFLSCTLHWYWKKKSIRNRWGDKSVGLWSVNTYVNFVLRGSIRNGNRTSVSNCLYSVAQYNGSTHIELNLRRDL